MATILIIEDDRETNEAICEYLKSAGHITFSVYDGADALTVFAQRNIDLVVLDIMLPTITGLGVLHEIRKKSSVPVLMLTAIKDEYTQVTSFDEQADDYVTKPFSMVLLGKRITALLRRNGKADISNTINFGDVTVDFSGYTAKDTNGKIDLTPKEIDLLRLLVEHKPFYRPDYARNKRDGGNGLGLYIVACILNYLDLPYSFCPMKEPNGMRFTISLQSF